MGAKRLYTKEQSDFIINNYYKIGRNKCAEILNIPKRTMYQYVKSLGMIIKNKIDENKKQFIINNYNQLGIKYCIEKTGLNYEQIRNIARKNNLKIDKKILSETLSNVCPQKKYYSNIEMFLNITKPEIAYLLGILWADGHIHKLCNGVSMTLRKEDMDSIINIINMSGNWGIYENTKKITGKIYTTIRITDIYFHRFLKEYDYRIKSGASADKILSKIPENLRHYWWHGYIDGDGCFSKPDHFSITSVYNQNWSFYEKLCKQLNIKLFIKLNKTNNSKSSCVRIYRKEEIKILGKYIYENYQNDKIGFDRKYQKYLNIINSIYIPKKFYTCYDKQRNKFALIMKINGKIKYIKRFKTKEEANNYAINLINSSHEETVRKDC